MNPSGKLRQPENKLGNQRRKTQRGRPIGCRRLAFEPLEDRRMLSSVGLVSAAQSGFPSRTGNGGSSLGPDWASASSLSTDGRYVAFMSEATNLVPGLAIVPGFANIYRFDRYTNEILLVSVNMDGTGSGNATSSTPAISADGSIVAFLSAASNLHALDTDAVDDIFARDLNTGITHLVTVNMDGTGSGNDNSFRDLVISADGSIVAFGSTASNLHALDANGKSDVFARNLTTNTTHLVSINIDGTGSGNDDSRGPEVSADGSVIGFHSQASNLHPLDANEYSDVFARNLTTSTTHLVSVNMDGTGSGNRDSWVGAISANGSVVAFDSRARDLHPLAAQTKPKPDTAQYDVYARDLTTDTTHLVSVNRTNDGSGDYWSFGAVINADGTVVAFVSWASDLSPVEGASDWQVYARNLTTNTTHLVSINADGDGRMNGFTYGPSINADGSIIAFVSRSSNLHDLDKDNNLDVFARNLTTSTTHLVSVNTAGDGSGNGPSDTPVISADGSLVAFASDANNLVAGDWNELSDVFYRLLAAEPPPTLPTSGRVTAAVKKGSLIVSGIGEENAVEVRSGDGPGTWVVSGLDGTMVNGKASETLRGVTRDLVIRMAGRRDEVLMRDGAVPRHLIVQMGVGDHRAFFQSVTTGGNLVLDSAASLGVDIHVRDLAVGGNLQIHGGADSDRFDFDRTTVRRDLTARLGGGADMVRFLDGSVGRDLSARLGGGGANHVWSIPAPDGLETLAGDFLEIGNSVIGRDLLVQTDTRADDLATVWVSGGHISRDAKLRGGHGPDTIGVQRTQIERDLRIDSGAGDDVVDLSNIWIWRNADVRSASGNNRTEIDGFVVHALFALYGGQGDDQVLVGTRRSWLLMKAQTARFQMGSGSDTLVVMGAALGNLSVDMNDDDDRLTVRQNSVTGKADLRGGRGNDRLNENLLVSNTLSSLSMREFEYLLS